MSINLRNRNRMSSLRVAGFSLIDVMIAVVVLATGMLAMAALQAGLTRSAAETRSRSNAVSIANGVLDAVRSVADQSAAAYGGLTGDTVVADVVTTRGSWKAAVDAREGNTTLTEPVAGTYGDTFSLAVEVQRYIAERRVGECGSVANTPCFRAAGAGTSDAPEFKRVEATVRWTDAAGEPQEITLSDVLSGLPSSNSRLLVARPVSRGNVSGGPRVLIRVPSEQGIIPIAIGADEYGRDRSTAATNPKPLRDQTTGSAGTSYEVLTYAAQGANAEIQRRLDVNVVTCECRYGAPPVESGAPTGTTSFFQTKLRPAFWSGTRYSVPESNDQVSLITEDAWGTLAPQSALCNDCCRDHHDPALTADQAAFSPYRSAHEHFDDVGSVLADPDDGDLYEEACRLIRVDGFFRVTPDVRLEHMSFLETKTTAKDFVPTTTAQTFYTTFVKDYLGARVIPTATFTSNAPAASLDDALDAPAFVPMTISGDRRFLHTRGLYLDYLVPDTRTFLESKLSNCTLTPEIDCLLPFLPFSSLNATELARYGRTPTDPDPATLSVTTGQINRDTTRPDGGVMTPVSANAQDGDVAFGLAEMARENTGQTDGGSVVNLLDAPGSSSDPNYKRTDSQEVHFLADAGADSDADGIENAVDNCDFVANPDQLNTDGDAMGNACDDDDDNDTILDGSDSCPLDRDSGRDTDGDGIDDVCDTVDDDRDDDGVWDLRDNCPDVANPGQEDVVAPLTGGRIGDACDDRDSDNDGVRDGVDNCPMVANSGQEDANGFEDFPVTGDPAHFRGDACEFIDRDGDGIADDRDNCPSIANPDQADSDSDGIGDVCDSFAPIVVPVTVNVAGVNMSTVSPKPNVAWSVTVTQNLCQPASSASNASPNPYSCDGVSAADITVLFGRYNRLVTAGSNSEEVTNPCRNVNPAPAPNGPAKVFPATCYNYRLGSATINGVTAPIGSAGVTGSGVNEVTDLPVTGLTNNVPVVANFVLQDATSAITTVQYTCGAFNTPDISSTFCQ